MLPQKPSSRSSKRFFFLGGAHAEPAWPSSFTQAGVCEHVSWNILTTRGEKKKETKHVITIITITKKPKLINYNNKNNNNAPLTKTKTLIKHHQSLDTTEELKQTERKDLKRLTEGTWQISVFPWSNICLKFNFNVRPHYLGCKCST